MTSWVSSCWSTCLLPSSLFWAVIFLFKQKDGDAVKWGTSGSPSRCKKCEQPLLLWIISFCMGVIGFNLIYFYRAIFGLLSCQASNLVVIVHLDVHQVFHFCLIKMLLLLWKKDYGHNNCYHHQHHSDYNWMDLDKKMIRCWKLSWHLIFYVVHQPTYYFH